MERALQKRLGGCGESPTFGHPRGTGGCHRGARNSLYAGEGVILFGPLARGEARWEWDADTLIGRPLAGRYTIGQICRLCRAACPNNRLARRPEAIERRDAGGAPLIQEALDHSERSLLDHAEVLFGGSFCVAPERKRPPAAMAPEPIPTPRSLNRLQPPAKKPVSAGDNLSLALLLLRPPLVPGW